MANNMLYVVSSLLSSFCVEGLKPQRTRHFELSCMFCRKLVVYSINCFTYYTIHKIGTYISSICSGKWRPPIYHYTGAGTLPYTPAHHFPFLEVPTCLFLVLDFGTFLVTPYNFPKCRCRFSTPRSGPPNVPKIPFWTWFSSICCLEVIILSCTYSN